MADRFDGDATAISMGPTGAVAALKHALAMGVGSALQVEHDALNEID
jgi:electron transfer flavoprotein alpha/beta subunit